MNIFNPKYFKFFLALTVLIIVFFVYSFYTTSGSRPPKISQINPLDHSTNISIYTTIQITFSRDVDPKTLSYTISPEIPITATYPQNNMGNITPSRPLQPNTQYSLSILWNNKSIKTTTFTTQASQTDSALIENMKNELARDYPLGQKLPLNEPGYSVVYSAPLTLEITLKNDSAGRDEVINAVRDWVKQNGLDPASHTYAFAN